jgi:hypothetical protein
MTAVIEQIYDIPCDALFIELKRADRHLFDFVCCALGYNGKALSRCVRQEIEEECALLVRNWEAALNRGAGPVRISDQIQGLLARCWELNEEIYAIRSVDAFVLPYD